MIRGIPNDRLLLGMKGTTSELELSLFRQRSQEALKQKARRGASFLSVAAGYVRAGRDRIEKDPDQRVQEALSLVFAKFAEFHSVRQVHVWLRDEGIALPVACQRAAERRSIAWRLPLYNTVHNILTNPVYAGAYACKGVNNTKRETHPVQRRPNCRRMRVGAVLLLIAFFALIPVSTHAFVAAGDRVFPGTLILPQIAPTDETYIQAATPFSGTLVPSNTRRTDVIGVFGKTLTERLGIRFRGVYTRLDPNGMSSRYGWQPLTATAQYTAVLDGPHEFLFSVGVDRQFSGTGAGRVQRRGFSGVGATTPSIYFGKGLGDLDIGYLRPLAVSGTFGYLIADKSPRPDVAMPGFAIEYSIPYLQSKVRAFDLPDLIRGLTPITELFLTTPAGQAHGTANTALVAPGVIYAGEGWQFGIEAMIPMTRATGKGLGVTAQFHVWLDYLFPNSIGRPVFSSP